MRLGRICSFLLLGLLFASCEKAETPIILPPKGTAEMSHVDMGDEYLDQFFFDFETGSVVLKSSVNSWDFAFEASPSGYHLLMNGNKNFFIYNTHLTDPAAVTESKAAAVASMSWAFDAPSGLPDSSGVGEWKDASGNSRNEVYIIKFSDDTYKKFVVASVTDTSYEFKYGDISSTYLNTIHLHKDPNYNFTYFSFDNGGQAVVPEPPKNSWDIVFTRYRHIYYDLDNKAYPVTGVLLNLFNTTAIADSIHAFESINYALVSGTPFSNHRDVIGFDWKKYNFTTGMYETDARKCYVVKTRKQQYWKIHFIDFYSSLGVKGSPTFEFEQIQ